MAVELKRQREVFEPFLKNYAPELENKRISVPLDSFAWRIETDNDRQDFPRVLAGDGQWQQVQIPHYGPPLGKAVTYYRTEFNVTPEMLAKGALFICFKGVDYKSHVFINNYYLGSHEGFFAPFEFEFTGQARPGNNVLLVKVENDFICMGSRANDSNEKFSGDKIYASTGCGYDDPEIGWHHCPPGMGIYQDVFVEARNRIHFHDVYVRPLPKSDQAEAWIEVYNCDIEPKEIAIELSVYGQNFNQTILENFRYKPHSIHVPGLGDVAKRSDRNVPLLIGPGVNLFKIPLTITNAKKWEIQSPWLYQLQVKLFNDSENLLDIAKQQFGMRSFAMDENSIPKGRFYLNSEEVKLRGANTMGHLQQCVIKKDWDQLVDDILLAKICNMNFLRLTQRPVQPEIYQFCDRLGLMTQTDLPLFGVLRRNQFCEAVRQAGEMERLIRKYACNIIVSYINEPFPNAMDEPHRHLCREEMENFFKAADFVVHIANPDRVIKAVDGDYDPPEPGLPDNHCYCGWYNGHGLDLGQLHKGFWQRVKRDWNYGCGEFGSEGLDPVKLMRKYYPSHWLPQTLDDEKTWNPDQIVNAQTGRFHYMWFDTQDNLNDWVLKSQQHQHWITKLMTEAFRRNNSMNSFAIHLFIDAFPSGWMKTIVDVDRQPKPAYFTYREALTPLMTNLRSDRLTFYSGEEISLEAWICNDLNESPVNTTLHYCVEMDGKVLQAVIQT